MRNFPLIIALSLAICTAATDATDQNCRNFATEQLTSSWGMEQSGKFLIIVPESEKNAGSWNMSVTFNKDVSKEFGLDIPNVEDIRCLGRTCSLSSTLSFHGEELKLEYHVLFEGLPGEDPKLLEVKYNGLLLCFEKTSGMYIL